MSSPACLTFHCRLLWLLAPFALASVACAADDSADPSPLALPRLEKLYGAKHGTAKAVLGRQRDGEVFVWEEASHGTYTAYRRAGTMTSLEIEFEPSGAYANSTPDTWTAACLPLFMADFANGQTWAPAGKIDDPREAVTVHQRADGQLYAIARPGLLTLHTAADFKNAHPDFKLQTVATATSTGAKGGEDRARSTGTAPPPSTKPAATVQTAKASDQPPANSGEPGARQRMSFGDPPATAPAPAERAPAPAQSSVTSSSSPPPPAPSSPSPPAATPRPKPGSESPAVSMPRSEQPNDRTGESLVSPPMTWPSLADEVRGTAELRIQNLNPATIKLAIRADDKGRDVVVRPFRVKTITLPPGTYGTVMQDNGDPGTTRSGAGFDLPPDGLTISLSPAPTTTRTTIKR